jgi:hypothetical protein
LTFGIKTFRRGTIWACAEDLVLTTFPSSPSSSSIPCSGLALSSCVKRQTHSHYDDDVCSGLHYNIDCADHWFLSLPLCYLILCIERSVLVLVCTYTVCNSLVSERTSHSEDPLNQVASLRSIDHSLVTQVGLSQISEIIFFLATTI